MTTSIINISQVTPSKSYLREFTKSIQQEIEEGNYDPIQLSATLDFIGKACEESKKAIKEQTITELEKTPERKEYYGYEIQVTEAGISYDYSRCGDSQILSLYKELEELQARIKERETFLKGIKERFTIVDEASGEVMVLRPPAKKSTTTTKFTLK